jgi:hypothetical protein
LVKPERTSQRKRGLNSGPFFFYPKTDTPKTWNRRLIETAFRVEVVYQVQHKGAKVKVLALKNQILSFPRFALVKSRITVPSTDDFMRVNSATVREGRSGRVWPPDILRKFQTAEIITETSINHYVLRDRSISPVRSV